MFVGVAEGQAGKKKKRVLKRIIRTKKPDGTYTTKEVIISDPKEVEELYRDVFQFSLVMNFYVVLENCCNCVFQDSQLFVLLHVGGPLSCKEKCTERDQPKGRC